MALDLKKAVIKNMVLLSLCMTIFYLTAVMITALSPITIVNLLGNSYFSGLTPAIFFLSSAIIALPAGKFIDKVGLMPVVAGGFLAGIIGNCLIAVSVLLESVAIDLLGFVLTGCAVGSIMLSRVAGVDMFPPEKQGRAVGLILMGAVVGGIVGPFVFSPIFNDIAHDNKAIVFSWFVGAAFMGLGFVVALFVRPDPKKIALEIDPNYAKQIKQKPESIWSLLKKPSMSSTLATSIASHALMVSLMSLMSYIMAHKHHHGDTILFTIGMHYVGMFGLALFTGKLVDKFGFRIILICGILIIMSAFAILLISESEFQFIYVMFALGLGWNMSFVASTTRVASLVLPHERGKIIGFNDFIAGSAGAILALLGGIAFAKFGVISISAAGIIILCIPLFLIMIDKR